MLPDIKIIIVKNKNRIHIHFFSFMITTCGWVPLVLLCFSFSSHFVHLGKFSLSLSLVCSASSHFYIKKTAICIWRHSLVTSADNNQNSTFRQKSFVQKILDRWSLNFMLGKGAFVGHERVTTCKLGLASQIISSVLLQLL